MMSGTVVQNTDYLKLSAEDIAIQNELVTTKRMKTYFVPAIFFWAGGESTQTDVNNQYFINLFSEVLRQKDDVYNLKSTLDDRTLEIRLIKVPNIYQYKSNWYFFFALYVYGYGAKEAFSNINSILEVSYTIKDQSGEELKSGQFAMDHKYVMNGIQSGSSLAGRYFQNLENELYNQSSELIGLIFDEVYKLKKN